ncbi:MAG: hypothetical protein LUQ38_09965 [Methanotrichaceae archaeon]|nr:hypothetical protein [Methanotrichaceae archaeon]
MKIGLKLALALALVALGSDAEILQFTGRDPNTAEHSATDRHNNKSLTSS